MTVNLVVENSRWGKWLKGAHGGFETDLAVVMEPRQRQPFKIAIIGGGIGGLHAALSLHYQCKGDNIQIDVYEQATQYSEIGAGVGIGVNAAKLLHRIGLGEAMNNIAGDRNGIWISFRRYNNGEEIVTVPANDVHTVRQLPVNRAEFLDLLCQAVGDWGAATLDTKKICERIEVSIKICSLSWSLSVIGR